MEVKDLISLLEDTKIEKIQKIKYKKHNISSNYILAKIDFTTIENMQDFVDTISNILVDLNKLQDRIIERNRK